MFIQLPIKLVGLIMLWFSGRVLAHVDHDFSSTVFPQHRSMGEDSSGEECNAVDKCEMCSFSDQKAIPACKETGRMQKFECVQVGGDNGESSF